MMIKASDLKFYDYESMGYTDSDFEDMEKDENDNIKDLEFREVPIPEELPNNTPLLLPSQENNK